MLKIESPRWHEFMSNETQRPVELLDFLWFLNGVARSMWKILSKWYIWCLQFGRICLVWLYVKFFFKFSFLFFFTFFFTFYFFLYINWILFVPFHLYSSIFSSFQLDSCPDPWQKQNISCKLCCCKCQFQFQFTGSNYVNDDNFSIVCSNDFPVR